MGHGKNIITAGVASLVIGFGKLGYDTYIQTHGDFGISPVAPLGTYEKIDNHLVRWNDLERQAPIDTPAPDGTALKTYRYLDTKDHRNDQYISLVVDGAGKVREVGGSFSMYRSVKVYEFFLNIWDKLTGAERKFEPATESGPLVRNYKLAKISKDNIEGLWTQDQPMYAPEFVKITLKEPVNP